LSAESRKVVIAALVGNSLIAATKFAAAALTGSSAMFAEGIHSTVDTGNQGLLLLGMRRSRRPPDPEFPFGHGKEIYFWSFVVAMLIFGLGAVLSVYEGIQGLLHPEPLRNPYVNYVVLAIAFCFEAGAWFLAWRAFNRTRGARGYFRAVREAKDPTVFAVLFEDSAAMMGLVLAFAGVALAQVTGEWRFDAAASIGIGLVLAFTAAWLARESMGLLIGESARGEVVEGIRGIVADSVHVAAVNEVLTLHMGPGYVLATISVSFRHGLGSAELERSVEEMTRAIRERYPVVKRVFMEAEPRPV